MALQNTYRQWRNAWKSWRLKIGHALLDKNMPVAQLPLQQDAPRILFIRHDGKLGDYIISAFVFREIKKQWPKAYIAVVAAPGNAGLLQANEYIDDVFVVQKKNHTAFKKLGAMLATKQFDVLIDPTEVLRNRDLTLIRHVNATMNIGYEQTLKLFNVVVDNQQQRMQTVYHEILVLLGCTMVSNHCDMPFEQAANDTVKLFLEQNAVQNYIAVNLYGASKHRQFSIDRAIDLLHVLKQQYPAYHLVILSEPKKQEEVHEIVTQMADSHIIALLPTKTISENMALIRQACAVVTPDTAITHIAAALDKKMVAFYGQDERNFEKWRPTNESECLIVRYGDELNDADFSIIEKSAFRLC